jgi:uncharacterized protein YjbI with pentapeptide repeats
MANKEHVPILKKGADAWNKWRIERHISPDLSGEHLSEAHLCGADLCQAILTGANLGGAHLDHANLRF